MSERQPNRRRRGAPPAGPIITVTLNTAIDLTIEVPRFAIGSHLPGRRLSRQPAGKGINVSRALARLGRSSIATGFVGCDELPLFDQTLRDDTQGLAGPQLHPVPGHTRQNITVIDPVARTDTHIREAGFEILAADIRRLGAKLRRLALPDAIVAISGSLPRGMAPGQLAELLDPLGRSGCRLALDLSGQVLRHVLATVDTSLLLIKPNLAELSELLGCGLPADETAVIELARPLTARARWIAISRGAQGALLVGAEEAWTGYIRVNPVDVVNTVGCGDCMLAGLIDAASDDLPPPRMLRRGLALATANTFQVGAANFDPTLIPSLERRVQVQGR